LATWQFGPFDNDDAVEWCADLEATAPDRRVDLVRQTLQAAVTSNPAATPGNAARAAAAAATVLQSLTGTPSTGSAYAPRFLLDDRDILVDAPLRELAIRALDSVLAEGSAWRQHWADNVEEDEALRAIEELRDGLTLGRKRP